MDKSFKDMTVQEIKDLKEQYRQKFIKHIGEFFEKNPLVENIFLFDLKEYRLNSLYYGDSISFTKNNIANYISKVKLKNEPKI